VNFGVKPQIDYKGAKDEEEKWIRNSIEQWNRNRPQNDFKESGTCAWRRRGHAFMEADSLPGLATTL
jgi:hypothetical protein